MRPTNRKRVRVTFIAALLLGVALGSSAVPPAHAEPTTSERRKVAEEVAASVCIKVPSIPKLPATIDPSALCRSVMVENIDPEGNNAGVEAACTAALPLPLKPAAKYCASVIDKLLDPARQLFLDKVVPVVQQLACVTSAPAAFDCVAQQMHVWLKQSIVSLWQGLISVLSSDTKAISVIDGWRNTGIVSLYSDIGAIGATLLLGLMLVSLIVSAIRFDFRQFGSTILGVVVWGMFWSGGALVAVLLMKASDDASRWLAGRPNAAGETDLSRAGKEFGNWVDYVTGATPNVPGGVHPIYNPGSLTAILICLLLIAAIVMTMVALVMRSVALLLLIILLPLTLAGAAGPRMTRHWFTSALRLFIALLLAKPLIVIAVRLGAVLVSVPRQGEPQATFSDAMLGVVIILLAGLLPGVIYRFSGGLMNTSAGSPPRASGGLSGQTAQSAQSSMDMTRMIMDRNAPHTLAAPTAGGGRALAGSGATAGAKGLGSGLGAAAGPIGLVAVGAAMAAGAVESGGRWLAGHAATGGGVLGDVEAPHVPSPPISRMGHLPSRAGAQQPPRLPSQPARTGTNASGSVGRERVTITQTGYSTMPIPPGPALPSTGPHLVIPGTVVPDGPTPVLPAAPRALTRGSGGTNGGSDKGSGGGGS